MDYGPGMIFMPQALIGTLGEWPASAHVRSPSLFFAWHTGL